MADDLRTMICADALGLAKSTLSHLISFHSTASRIYGPTECNNQLIQVAKFRPEVKVLYTVCDRAGWGFCSYLETRKNDGPKQ